MMRLTDPFPTAQQGILPTHVLEWEAMARKVVREVLQVTPNERVIWSGKVRRHGRWVAGFFWGLLLGVGIGLFGWQDARWTVNLGSIVLLPLAVAVAAGVIAWWGWGYRIRDVVVLPRSAEPPPPEADVAPASAGSGADVDPVADDNTAPTDTPNGSGAGSDPAVLKLDPERTPEV